MLNTLSFAVGDLLVRHGKVLKVSHVKKDSIDLQPYFNLKASHGLTYSVQLQNSHNPNLRKPVSREKAEQLLVSISKLPNKTAALNLLEIKSALNTNELAETLKLLQQLWLEKQDKSGFLAGGKLGIYQQAMIQATQEIAAAKGILLEKAELLILSTLKNSQPSVSIS
ncbi:MAG: hypothetical protein NTZ93_00510 [Candidatus Beckwithbacteria bacterium]|nr:hypothetical protein [Candidatus Beckwithbacteria bacterium]